MTFSQIDANSSLEQITKGEIWALNRARFKVTEIVRTWAVTDVTIRKYFDGTEKHILTTTIGVSK
jgi:hypothetical protein